MIPLDYGNPGDRIPVLLDNGQIKILTAGNVINSSEIQVHGDYVFSAGSPKTETIDRQIFKKRPREKEQPISCQLVASSLWVGSSNFNNGNHPYAAPYYELVDNQPWFTWSYDAAQNACQVDVNGIYPSAASCLEANSTGLITPMIEERSLTATTSIEGNYNSPAIIQQKGDVYVLLGNGDTAYNGNGVRGLNNYGLTSKKAYITATIESPNVWRRVRYLNSSGQLITLVKTLTDGSVRLNGETLNLSGWTLSEGTYTKPVAPGEVLAFEFFPSEVIPPGSTVTSVSTGLYTSTFWLRGTVPFYPTYNAVNSYFVKIHDPDLPPVKVAEYPFNHDYDLFYVFLGDKAYFFAKKGRVFSSSIPYGDRPFYAITVIRLDISATSITKTETEFVYPDSYNFSDDDFIFQDKVNSYTNPIPSTGDPCIDDDNLFLTRAREYKETNHQRSPNNNYIIEYKVPGIVINVGG